jgi:hypothetical protein
MSDKTVFLYAAVYHEIAEAEAGYEAVFDLHAAGAMGESRASRPEGRGSFHGSTESW